MRKILYTIAFTLALNSALAQTNFYKIGWGGGLGGTYSFTDVKKGGLGYSAYTAVDFYFTPFISANLEIQKGLVKGGNVDTDPHNRQFSNSFLSYSIGGKARLGEFVDYDYKEFLNYAKGFYLGLGIGKINNNVDAIRIKPDGSNYRFPGEDKSSNFVIPINIGADFYFFDTWGTMRYTLNVNLQSNIVTGEGLDGYNDPPTIFRNNNPDIYTFFSIGFKYHFGPTGLASKAIR